MCKIFTERPRIYEWFKLYFWSCLWINCTFISEPFKGNSTACVMSYFLSSKESKMIEKSLFFFRIMKSLYKHFDLTLMLVCNISFQKYPGIHTFSWEFKHIVNVHLPHLEYVVRVSLLFCTVNNSPEWHSALQVHIWSDVTCKWVDLWQHNNSANTHNISSQWSKS